MSSVMSGQNKMSSCSYGKMIAIVYKGEIIKYLLLNYNLT